MQRSLSDHSRTAAAAEDDSSGGPKAARPSASPIQQLTGQECVEALSMMNHSADDAVVREKMMATFEHRQKLVHDPDTSVDVLETFPRFLDIPGLVSIFCVYKLLLESFTSAYLGLGYIISQLN